MAKKTNRFSFDISRRGKFPFDTITHNLPPRFIAKVELYSEADYLKIAEGFSSIPMAETGYSFKKLTSGKYLVLFVIDLWDGIGSEPNDIQSMQTVLALALNSYYSFMMNQVKEANVQFDDLVKCLEYVDMNVRNSELRYYSERHTLPDDTKEAYHNSLSLLKQIRTYLKQLYVTCGKYADRY